MPDLALELAKPFNELDPGVKEILGRPNFFCGQLAEILRLDGVEIPCKAEMEQAAVIQFLLSIWEHHGDQWKTEGNRIIQEIIDRHRAEGAKA